MPATPPSFEDLVRAYRALLQTPAADIADSAPAAADLAPEPATDAPACLVFSPHPDDEALVGGLPLRLRRECGWRVINVAVTLGSRLDRRAARWAELQDSCRLLGFELLGAGLAPEEGLEGIRPAEAQAKSPVWQTAVTRIAALLTQYQPQAVVCPHALDGHEVHIATSLLVQQALQTSPLLCTHLLLSEYWSTQLEPRLMMELSDADVGHLMQATALHVGEVSRNPYHLSLPAWLIDSARRGAERVGRQGAAATGMAFAALYGWQRWAGGVAHDMPRQAVRCTDDLQALFRA